MAFLVLLFGLGWNPMSEKWRTNHQLRLAWSLVMTSRGGVGGRLARGGKRGRLQGQLRTSGSTLGRRLAGSITTTVGTESKPRRGRGR